MPIFALLGLAKNLPWKWIMIGLAILALVLFAAHKVREHDRDVVEKERQRVEIIQLKADKRILEAAQANINQAVDTNAQNTQIIEHRSQQIVEKIREVPVTQKCESAPAIGVVLDDYRARTERLRNEQQDGPRTGD